MFEQADALFVVAGLKVVIGRAILIGLIFLAGFKYINAINISSNAINAHPVELITW